MPLASSHVDSSSLRLSIQQDSRNTPGLWSLWSVVIAGEAIFVLPFVLPRLFRPTMISAWGLSNTDIGLAFSAYGVVAVMAYFLGGPLADRWNNRRLMSLALVATAAGSLLFLQTPTALRLKWLYAYFGLTTILLFWAPMIRVTHRLAGPADRGAGFGLLDAGRGLFAALLASGLVLIFDSIAEADDRDAAIQALQIIVVLSGLLVLVSGCLLFFCLPSVEKHEQDRQRHAFRFANIPVLMKRPGLWVQCVIVFAAYCAYKSIDNMGIYVVDVLDGSESDAAWMTTLCFWARPISALVAGLVADRLGRFQVLAMLFAVVTIGCVLLASGNPAFTSMASLSVLVASTGAAVYGLRGVYFSIFDEVQVPMRLIGTATGIVSVVGFLPDVFFGSLSGHFLDAYPGLTGHRIVYSAVALIAAIGCLVSVGGRKLGFKPDTEK